MNKQLFKINKALIRIKDKAFLLNKDKAFKMS